MRTILLRDPSGTPVRRQDAYAARARTAPRPMRGGPRPTLRQSGRYPEEFTYFDRGKKVSLPVSRDNTSRLLKEGDVPRSGTAGASPWARSREARRRRLTVDPLFVLRRGMIVTIAVLVATALALTVSQRLGLLGVPLVFLCLGSTILLDRAVRGRSAWDPRFGALMLVAGIFGVVLVLVAALT